MEPILFIVNGPAYGTENAFNASRWAKTLSERPEMRLRMLVIGDAVTCTMNDQNLMMGLDNLAKMAFLAIEKGVEVGAYGMCMDARSITDEDLVTGTYRGSMKDLDEWIVEAKRVVSF